MNYIMEQRKKFIKDGPYPIPVTHSPYFEYFLELYENVYQTKSKWDQIMNHPLGHQEFFKQANQLTKKIVHTIEATEEFEQEFKNQKSAPPKRDSGLPKNIVYSPQFVGRTLISVDINSANFTSLKHSNPKIVFDCATYKELVEKIALSTDFDSEVIQYVSTNKGLRQVIFGQLNSKKQQIVQRNIVAQIVDCLVGGGIEKDSIVRCTSDEVIFQLGVDENVSECYNKTKEVLENGLPQFVGDLKVEVYVLHKIENSKTGEMAGYLKQFLCGSSTKGLDSELKAVSKYLFAQVYKKTINAPVVENDLVFTHEGMVAQFKQGFFDLVLE